MSEPIELREGEEVTAPGAYRISEALYHRDPCLAPSLSNSLAKTLLAASPEQAWWEHPRLNPEWTPGPSKKHYELGSACHKGLLGAGAPLVIIEANDYKKKAAQAERDEATLMGSIPILAAEYEKSERMVELAKSRLGGLTPSAGDAEVMIAGELPNGIWARCKLDWWSEDRRTVIDYKTTGLLASPNSFATQLARMKYHFQAAFYRQLIGEVYPELAGRITFLFMVQEMKPVHGIATYDLDEGDMTVAGRQVDAAVDLWGECLERGEWPGYPTGIQRARLPDWTHREWLERELAAEEEGGGLWAFAGRTE